MRFGERAQARSFLLGRPGGVRLPGSGARCWVGLPGFLAWRVAMGLGELQVAGSKLCGLRTFPHRRLRCLATVGAGSAAAWKYGKPLVQGIGGIADSKYCYRRIGGRADMSPALGACGVWLGKGKLGWCGWQRAGCGFWGCCGCGNFGQFQNGNDVGCPWITVQQPWQDGTLYIKEPSKTPGLPASGSGWRAISAAHSPQA